MDGRAELPLLRDGRSLDEAVEVVAAARSTRWLAAR
jgi:hypothetical protein